MKRWMTLLLILCLAALLCLPAGADADNADLAKLDADAQEYLVGHTAEDGAFPRVVDIYDLLSDSEEESLTDTIEDIAARYDFDVVLLTVDGLSGKSPMEYADDFFDYGGYGYGSGRDGVLFLLSMADRDWWISTRGYGIAAFTDYGIDYIGDEVVPTYFSSGDYAEGFSEFLDVTGDFLREAKAGEAYDVDNTYKGYREDNDYYDDDGSISRRSRQHELTGKKVLISAGAGLLLALIIVFSMKKKMKTVYLQPKAGTYIQDGSFILSQQSDVFLYSHVTQTRRETSSSSGGGGSSTHFSSSGASHGGGGGKF
ncbi:MAG: TPM domain-containing protein [Clostridia bacterium]|nr:TPM domain-containing protein [Clostridia bacterium]